MARKAYKYRLYPTKKQEKVLFWTLTRCRELYNAALTERRDAYDIRVRRHPNYYDEPTRKQLSKEHAVSYYEQKRDLPDIKAELEAGAWYVVFSCEVEVPSPLPSVESEVGIDLGITHFAALSDGTFIESPRYYRKAQAALKRKQHILSKRKRGSHRRERARKAVAKAHRKIANQRRDFHHKQAKKLVQEHQVLVFEQLEITNISKRAKPKQDENGTYLPNGAAAKSGLNKSILDAGWGQFQQIISHKAACAGREVLKVNPKYTSQVCSQCGTVKKKSLEERWHSCECGCELDRDTNAAINILRLGRSQRVPPSRASVRSHVEAPAF